MRLSTLVRIVLLVVALSGLAGCGTYPKVPAAAPGSSPSGSTPAGGTAKDTGGMWRAVVGPRVAGLEAVQTGWAVEVEERAGQEGLTRRALIVPASRSYRVEQYGAAGTSVTVLVGDRRFLFIPGDGVVDLPAPEPASGGPDLAWAYGQSLLDRVPANATWEQQDSRYRGRFSLPLGEGGGDVDVTLEIDVDPDTGIALRESMSSPQGSGEIRRRILPVAAVRAPDQADVREAAQRHWDQQLEAARQVGFPVVGLDLPGLMLKRVRTAPSKVTLDYGLPGLPPAAVMIEQFPVEDPSASTILAQWGTATYDEGARLIAFRRGGSVIRLSITDGSTIGLPEDPFAGLKLTLEGVRDALVPLDRLPTESLAPPALVTWGRRARERGGDLGDGGVAAVKDRTGLREDRTPAPTVQTSDRDWIPGSTLASGEGAVALRPSPG